MALNQARSKQCMIGPAIANLSAGDLGVGWAIQWGSGHSPAPNCILSKI